jgi:hypothetical protein
MKREDFRFGITTWPYPRLPHPYKAAPENGYVIVGGALRARHLQRAEPTSAAHGELDADLVWGVGETYLELATVDLEDEAAILGFTNRYRTLGVRDGDYDAFENFPGIARLKSRFEKDWARRGGTPKLSLEAELLEEFRFGARCVRDLVAAWRLLSEGEPLEQWESLPAGAEWFSADMRAQAKAAGVVPRLEDEAVYLLTMLMEPALAKFQPRILKGPWGNLPSELTMATASLYRICCIELYNHIAEDVRYRRCANRPCSKLFVRHKGRARRGQHRTRGVSYCSIKCRNAAGVRHHRARLAAG